MEMEQELRQWLAETLDEPLEEMTDFFDARLDDYEAHMARWYEHYQWMAALLPASTKDLLDLGCGSGLELDAIFVRYPALCVTGIDLSRNMLKMLRQKHKDKSLQLICGDYFHVGLGEDRFDAAVSFETLHHFDARQKAALFAKVYRCLRPGGVYLECDYIAQTEEMEDMLFAACARKRERENMAPDVFVHFDTPLTLAHEMQAIRAGGFQEVTCLGFLPGDVHTQMIRALKMPPSKA